MTVPILNYTTKVDVFTTLGEIQAQLVKHGARKIMQDYDDSGQTLFQCYKNKQLAIGGY